MLKQRFVIVVTTVATSVAASGVERWPAVKPTRVEWAFTHLERDTPGILLIRDVRSIPIYKLECHNGEFDNGGGYNYSGDFQCTLFAIEGERRTSWNLLATDNDDERSSDWFNRGRMLASQLRGTCGQSAYGTKRRFRLRGMDLTFLFKKLRWRGDNPDVLDGFTFEAVVRRDESATSPVSERVPDKYCDGSNDSDDLASSNDLRLGMQCPDAPGDVPEVAHSRPRGA